MFGHLDKTMQPFISMLTFNCSIGYKFGTTTEIQICISSVNSECELFVNVLKICNVPVAVNLTNARFFSKKGFGKILGKG